MSYAIEFSKQFNEQEFYTKDILTPSSNTSHRKTHTYLVPSIISSSAAFTGALKQLKLIIHVYNTEDFSINLNSHHGNFTIRIKGKLITLFTFCC